MSDKILYAKQIDEAPSSDVPIAKEPHVIIGEYIETDDLQHNIINSTIVDKCWQFSANVRFITGVDILCGILNGVFFNPWLFLTCIIPLCGYQGATQFCTIKTMLYIIYSYTNSFSRYIEVFQLMNYSTDNSTQINNTISAYYIEHDINVSIGVLSMVGLFQLFISIYISIFLCKLYKLNKNEISVLRKRIKEHNINDFLCC